MAERAERRLTTILAADIAEYSRLMREDEEETIRGLAACRAIVDAMIAEHRGRIANTAGDSVLAEFPSVADGLACALAIQETLAGHNASIAAERRMLFRIGIHLGDVTERNGDLLGDAVNVAARLQALAEPGGICVSAAVREHAGPRIAADFADAGPQQVKNIAAPVHVFRVATRAVAPPSAAPVALSLPDKPSIAVLPFANMSSDPEQEFLADGIAEDVITALSRYPSLFVIARNSCFTYKGRAVDVKTVGRELGVRYVLEGSLRKAGNRIRVTAQLVEAETGNHVWAERYDRDLADLFAVQDEISDKVTIAVAPAVDEAERQRAMRKPPGSLDAWTAYQRGLWYFGKLTAEDNALAQRYFQQAIDLDPGFTGGFTGLALAHHYAAAVFARRSLPEMQRSAESLARRALALDPTNAEAVACLSLALLARGDHDGAIAEAERALSMCPNLPGGHGALGTALTYWGHPKEGVVAHETHLRLDPCSPARWLLMHRVAVARYFAREYDAAIEAAKRTIRSYPDFPISYRWLAAALGQTGRTQEASEVLQKALAFPSFDLYVHQRPPWMRPEDHAHMLDGLRKAGWQG